MDSSYFWLVIASLATWRLTSILYREKIATPIRYWIGERKDIHTGKETYPDTFIGKVIACFWCLSVWCGIVVLLIWFVFPYILIPLALSAISILIEQRVE